MRCLRLLLLLALVPGVAVAQTQVGAGGGGWLYASAFHPQNSSTMLIGSDMAGVMRSTNGGATWVPWISGLLPTAGSTRKTTYVQDICPINYNGFVGYYIATVGGIFKAADGTGSWVDQTPPSNYWYECRYIEGADTTDVQHLSIPFASLSSAGSRVFAGAGLNRLSMSPYSNFSNAIWAYGGLRSPYSMLVDSSTDTAQVSVWYLDMDSTATFQPYQAPCSFGAARSVSAAVVNDTTYVAVSTERGIYLHNGVAWRVLSDNPLYAYAQTDSISGTYYGYGQGAKLAAWSIHLTPRGTLYAAMQRIDSTDNVNASGVYRIFDVTDGDNCRWTWVGDGATVDYNGQAGGTLSNKSLNQIGLLNVISTVPVRTFLVYLSVHDGTGESPDRLYLGEARAAFAGLYRGEQPYDEDRDSGHWHLTFYRNEVTGTVWNLKSDGTGQDPLDSGWIGEEDLAQPIPIHKPAIAAVDADRVLVCPNGTLLTSSDSYTYDNAYCTAVGSCWATNGYTEMVTLDLAFTSDGRLITCNGDFGSFLSCDDEAESFERLDIPYSNRETSAVAVDRDVHGSGEDAVYIAAGEALAFSGPCAVFRRLRDISSGAWSGDWQNITSSFTSGSTYYIFYDIEIAGVDTCFVSYGARGQYDSWPTTFGVKRGVLNGTTWTWVDVADGLSGVKPRKMIYVASTHRLFLASRRTTSSYGGVHMLTSPSDTTWTLVYGGSANLSDFECVASAPYGGGAILFAGSATQGSTVGQIHKCTDADDGVSTWTAIANPSAMSSLAPTVTRIVSLPWATGERFIANYQVSRFTQYNGPWHYMKLRNGSNQWTWILGTSAWKGVGAFAMVFDPFNFGRVYMGTDGFEVLRTFYTPPTGEEPPPDQFQQRIMGDLRMRAGGDFSFALAMRSDVSITFYDLRGRLVRKESLRDLSPGVHGFNWDGLDQAGRRVASGTYLLRLTAGEQAITKKVVRIR